MPLTADVAVTRDVDARPAPGVVRRHHDGDQGKSPLSSGDRGSEDTIGVLTADLIGNVVTVGSET